MSTISSVALPLRQRHLTSKPEDGTEQKSQAAMIFVKDHTRTIIQSLAVKRFPATELKADSVAEQTDGAVLFVTIGVQELPASYYLFTLDLVDILVNWIYSDWGIEGTSLKLELLPEAAADPETQRRALGTALGDSIKSPLHNWEQCFQKIEAFRQRSIVEMDAWHNDRDEDLETHVDLIITLQAAIRCLDQCKLDFGSSVDFDSERFADRRTYMMTELLYANAIRPGAGHKDLKEAKYCLRQLRSNGYPDEAQAKLYIRLCMIDLRRGNYGAARRYIARVEELKLEDEESKILKEKVQRKVAELQSEYKAMRPTLSQVIEEELERNP
ncbi:MAG: hypothetical protein Q9226_002905 [Calogaya cf. arnoldii]